MLLIWFLARLFYYILKGFPNLRKICYNYNILSQTLKLKKIKKNVVLQTIIAIVLQLLQYYCWHPAQTIAILLPFALEQ